MTEIEKLKVQIETLEGVRPLIERNRVECEDDYSDVSHFAYGIVNDISAEIAKLRLRFKQLSRQLTAGANPAADIPQGTPQSAGAGLAE